MGQKIRKFNGKQFGLRYVESDKTKAKKRAKELRDYGVSARIIHSIKDKLYYIYGRGGKRFLSKIKKKL